MSLRLKSLLIFSVAMVLLFGIVMALVETIIERQFNDVEIQTMLKHAEHLSNELEEEFDPIISTVGDWAPWDELYSFVEGTNPTFPEKNLTEADLVNLHLDFFVIWRQDGTLVHLASSHENLKKERDISKGLLDAIRGQKLVPQKDITRPTSGFMIANHRILMVSSLPIVHSGRTGPPAGTLVGGRIFDAEDAKSIEEFSNFTFKFVPPARDNPYPKTEKAGVRPKPEVRIIDSQQISAAIPIYDTRGNFIATAELTSSRLLHLQAAKTIRIFLIALASAAGILLFVVWYLFDANVIHPVRRLAGKLAQAATRGQLPSDLGLTGGDELAQLARRIEDLARTVAQTEANYRAIVEDQTEFIFRYLPDGRRTFANEALCRYLGRPREDLIGGDAHSLVADEDFRKVSTALKHLTVQAPVVTLDHRVRTADGSLAWFRRTDRGVFSDTGELRELQCVARDITHAHIIREQLEASEARYRRLFETATDGILIVRQSNRTIADANPALCRILDCERSALLESRVADIVAFKTPRTLRALSRLLKGDQSIREGDIELPRGEGDPHFLQVTAGTYDTDKETIIQLNFRDVSQRKRTNDELRRLSGHLLRLQDDERRRIARELHDSTAQNLSALQMAVTHLELSIPESDTRARATLEEIRSLCDLSLKEIRTISYLLHPPLLDEVGLLFALRWYVDGFMTRTEKIVHLDMPESLERLPPEIETTIFRVIQEALSNIHRHSGSRRAWIRLTLEDGVLELDVRDEGRGAAPGPTGVYPPGFTSLGVGITGMRERLRQFGGSLEIESSREGTTVRARLPLEPHEPPED